MSDRCQRFAAALVRLTVLVALVSPAMSILAQERAYWIEDFQIEIDVREDGSIEVMERLRFRFDGSFNGIYRDIPMRYDSPWRVDYRLRIEPIAVTDGVGGRVRFETSREGEDLRFKVWVPDATDAARTVVLRYRVQRALRFPDAEEGFEAHDQLYWNATGTRWTVSILSASALVSLPDGITQEPQART